MLMTLNLIVHMAVYGIILSVGMGMLMGMLQSNGIEHEKICWEDGFVCICSLWEQIQVLPPISGEVNPTAGFARLRASHGGCECPPDTR